MLPFEFEVTSIDGEPTTLEEWRGDVLLIVNVASQCGYTPQYAGLEALFRTRRSQGFAVLGFPCDQFGHQEPGDEAEIKAFCSLNYDVSFPLFAKVDVRGRDAHPLFAWLGAEQPGLAGSKAIKWNFTKFLIDRTGRVVRRYAPSTAPEALAEDIDSLLAQERNPGTGG